MQTKHLSILPIFVFSLLLGSGHSAVASESLGISAKAGTLGLGAELSVSLLPHTRLRGGYNYLSYSFDSTIDDIDYEFEPEYNAFSLLLDVHPFGGAFFLSGGVYLNNNSVDASGSINRNSFSSSFPEYAFLADMVSITGDVEFNPVAPYAGFGWRTNSDTSGWGVAVELGVLFQGTPDVKNLRVNAPIDVNNIAEVQQFLARQEREIEEELDWFEFYPVASVMLIYNF
jgi:hypothetical protein